MSTANKKICLDFYSNGRWGIEKIIAACANGKITADEFKDITGEDYDGEPYIPSGRAADIESQLASQDEAIIALYETIGGAV